LWTHVNSADSNLLKAIDPLGSIQTYGYLNYRLFEATNALGNATSYAYDGNGFVTAARDALGNRCKVPIFSRRFSGNSVRSLACYAGVAEPPFAGVSGCPYRSRSSTACWASSIASSRSRKFSPRSPSRQGSERCS